MYDFWVGVSESSNVIVLPGKNDRIPKTWVENNEKTTWERSIYPERTLNRQSFSKRSDDFEIIKPSDIVKEIFSIVMYKLEAFRELVSMISIKYGERMVYRLLDSYISFEKNPYAKTVRTLFETIVSDDSKSPISDYNKLTVLLFDVNANNREWVNYYGYLGTPMFSSSDKNNNNKKKKNDIVGDILSGLSLKSFFKLFSDTIGYSKFKTDNLNRLWHFYASNTQCATENDHETFLKNISNALTLNSNEDRGLRSVWLERLKCFGNDRLKKWIPYWSTYVVNVVFFESGKRVSLKTSAAYLSYHKSESHLRLSKAFVDCYYEHSRLYISKTFKVTRSIQKDDAASKKSVYEKYHYDFNSVLKRDDDDKDDKTTTEPSLLAVGHKAFLKHVSETLFLNDATIGGGGGGDDDDDDLKYMSKFSFLNVNASDVFVACSQATRLYRMGVPPNDAFRYGQLQKNLVHHWIERGEYTLHPIWIDALVFVPPKYKDNLGDIVLEKDIYNNVLLLERYIYPLIKELSVFHLANVSDTKDYLEDYMRLMETIRKQIIYNTSKDFF